jgi:hypothetical protein
MEAMPPEEREAFWEKLYREPGFGIWLGNFGDIMVNERPMPRSANSSPGRYAGASRTRR